VGAKRPLKKTENRRRSKKSEKSERRKKIIIICAAILDSFQTKIFISETTSLHYFSPRIPNL
jgi:hypothetical protein